MKLLLIDNYEINSFQIYENMNNIEYICDLIIKENNQIYFKDEEHFKKFLKKPFDTKYYDKQFDKYNNILFYMANKNFNLLNDAIKYDVFDNIDINSEMKYIYKGSALNLNLLRFSCMFCNTITTHETIQILLDYTKTDVNFQNSNGDTVLMSSASYSKKDINDKKVKMLLKHPSIDVNLQDNNGWSALMLATNYANSDSTVNTVRLLLNHPNINVNLQDSIGRSALMLIVEDVYDDVVLKMLLNHPNINVNLQDRCKCTALISSTHSSIYDPTKKTVKMLLNHPTTNINLQDERGDTALTIAIKKIDCDQEEIIDIMLNRPEIDINISVTDIVIFCYNLIFFFFLQFLHSFFIIFFTSFLYFLKPFIFATNTFIIANISSDNSISVVFSSSLFIIFISAFEYVFNMFSINSYPNLANLSLYAITNSFILFFIPIFIIFVKPLLLKFNPEPISYIIS